jgi:phosphoketolase
MKRIANGEAAVQGPLSATELQRIHAYWSAANYLSVGQIYLLDNPLLAEPLLAKSWDGHGGNHEPPRSDRRGRDAPQLRRLA